MIISKVDLENYVANLSGILHLFASETQKLVLTYRTLITDIHCFGKSAVSPLTSEPVDVAKLGAEVFEFSCQWNVVMPLAEELKRLIEQEFEPETSAILTDLSTLLAKMESFFETMLADAKFLDSQGYQRYAQELKQFEVIFPTTTLKLLGQLKKNTSTHLTTVASRFREHRRNMSGVSIIGGLSLPSATIEAQPKPTSPLIREVSDEPADSTEVVSATSEKETGISVVHDDSTVLVNKSAANIEPVAEQTEPTPALSSRPPSPLRAKSVYEALESQVAEQSAANKPKPRENSVAGGVALAGETVEEIKRKVEFFEERIVQAAPIAAATPPVTESQGRRRASSIDRPKIAPKPVFVPKAADRRSNNPQQTLDEALAKASPQEKHVDFDYIRPPADVLPPQATKPVVLQVHNASTTMIEQADEVSVKKHTGKTTVIETAEERSMASPKTSVSNTAKNLDSFFGNSAPLKVAAEHDKPTIPNPAQEDNVSQIRTSSQVPSPGLSTKVNSVISSKSEASIVPPPPHSTVVAAPAINKIVSPRVTSILLDGSPSSIRHKDKRHASFYPEGFKAPTEEEDQAFLAALSPAKSAEIVLQALNGYQLLPTASPQAPFLRIFLQETARLGRSNTQGHKNFVTMGITQVISRNHLDIWFNADGKGGAGEFCIKDCGSNSGTWLNGQRLSEAGVPSVVVSVKTGDILRLGADYKAGTTPASAEEIRDIRQKCVITRLVCRKAEVRSPSNTTSNSRKEIYQSSATDSLPTMMLPSDNVNEIPIGLHPSVYKLQKEIDSKKASQKNQFKEEFGKLEERIQIARRSTKSDITSENYTTSSTPNLFELTSPKSAESRPISALLRDKSASNGVLPTRYSLAFTASTLPYRLKKVAIYSSSQTQQSGQDQTNDDNQESTPEIIQIQFKNWGTSKDHRQRFVLHDMRIYEAGNQSIGTFVEVVRNETNPSLYAVILTTGNILRESSSSGNLMSVQLATVDFSSDMKCKISPCFTPLKNHKTNTELLIPGPVRIQPQPVFTPKSRPTTEMEHAVTPIYLINNLPAPVEKFPSLSIVGNFSDPSNSQSLIQNVSNSFSNLSTSEEVLNGSNMLIVLKETVPSRSQKLIGEIRGKQGLKRGVRETKWSFDMEIMEDKIWEMMANCGGTEWNDFIRLQHSTDDGDLEHVDWVYRKEWWTLVVLASASLGFLKDS